METYKIDEQSLRETLKSALREALYFEWAGWRLPIYLDEETGQTSFGGWLSQGSWQPDAHELPIKIERWDMSEYWDNDQYKMVYDEYDVDYEVDERIAFILNKLTADDLYLERTYELFYPAN